MKLFTGWIMSAALVLAATSASAQVLAPNQGGGPRYSAVSDLDEPYSELPPEVPAPRYGPRLLPVPEVYTVVRENGFSPLGVPRQRGFLYTIAVIDREGDDGQLVIDARDGRIVRFVPAYRMGGEINREMNMTYGLVGSVTPVRGVPRPPAPIPRVASRTPMPVPRMMPPRTAEPRPLAAAPGAAQQSAAIEPKPAALAPSTVGAAPATAPQIRPTQEMPGVQDLE